MGAESPTLTQRAEHLVREWSGSIFGFDHGRFKAEGERLLDDIGRSPNVDGPEGIAALIVLLSLPTRSAAADLVTRVLDQLTNAGPALVKALPGVLRARARFEEPELTRATAVLDGMPTPDLVRGLLHVLRSETDDALRDEAFNELTRRGEEAAEELEELSGDPELGPLATRCREKVELCLPQSETSSDLALSIDQLGCAYVEAVTVEDAEYALDSLAELLEENEGRLDEAASRELEELVGGLVSAWFDADDPEDESIALDNLQCLVSACGSWFDTASIGLVRQIPVTPATEPLRDLIDDCVEERRFDGSAIGDQSRKPLMELLVEQHIDLSLAPGWTVPQDIDPETSCGQLLSILANDAVDELKGEVVESLVGEPDAVAELHLLEAHPKAADWVREVLRRDEEFAADAGLTLDEWAAQAPVTLLDELLASEEDDDVAPGAQTEITPGEGVPTDVPPGPPSVDDMKHDFEAFVRRMEDERT